MSALVNAVKPILSYNDAVYTIASKTYHLAKNQKNKIKINHKNNKLRSRIIEDWKEILAQLKICNAYTQTYTLKDIEFTKFGIKATIFYPKALTREKFKDILETLEEGIEAIIVPKYGEGKKRFFTVNIVAEDIPQTPFSKVITKPYELFLGYGLDTLAIVWDISKQPHLLVAGATGAGKSKFLMSIICNLILNTDEDELEIHALQVDKSDSYPFRRCKQVKCFADTLMKSLASLNYVNYLLDVRTKDIRPLLDAGLGEDIKEFNKLNKEKGWKYTFVWVDEFPSYMIDQGDSKEIKAIKYKIMQRIARIYQTGRYAGIFFLVGCQRSTMDKLPTFSKSQSTCIISMKQMNINSSMSAIDSTKATDLKEREGLIKLPNELQYVKTPFLTSPKMVELINPFRVSEQEQKKREFDFEKWLKYEPQIEGDLNIDDITLPTKSKDDNKQVNGNKDQKGKEKIDKQKEELKKQGDVIVLQKQQLIQANTKAMELEKTLSDTKTETNKFKVENEKIKADYNKLLIKLNQKENVVKTKNKLSTNSEGVNQDDN